MITLKVRAILRELDKTDFCIYSRTPLVLTLDPSKFLIPSSMSVDHPPSTSIMMLYCCTSYPGYCRFISHLRGAYLAVFSSSLLVRLSIHGQLISSAVTFSCWWSIKRASILFALTSVCSA